MLMSTPYRAVSRADGYWNGIPELAVEQAAVLRSVDKKLIRR